MSDALSEALMKLSAAKPVSDRNVPAAEAVAEAGDPEKLASTQASGPSSITPQAVSAIVAEASAAPAEPAPVCRLAAELPPVGSAPSPSSSFSSAPATVAKDAVATSTGWLLRIRELRGWVAAGIVLALLFTVVDDLRSRGAAHFGEVAAGSGSDVDLDELLKEFETAEPASHPERSEVVEMEPLPDTESEVTANYGDEEMVAEDEQSVSGAGSRVVRFAGRIEPLR